MSFEKGPCHAFGLVLVIHVATNQEDWSVAMVADPEWEAEPLPMWETELLPGDIGVGENTSLTKREC